MEEILSSFRVANSKRRTYLILWTVSLNKDKEDNLDRLVHRSMPQRIKDSSIDSCQWRSF